MATARGPVNRGKLERDERETNIQTNNQSSPMRKRKENMEEQNRVNEVKDKNTQRQEEVAGREKVGEGAIRKI